MFIRITAPHFVAGVDTVTKKCPPILNYMRHWDPYKIRDYCKYKNWGLEVLSYTITDVDRETKTVTFE